MDEPKTETLTTPENPHVVFELDKELDKWKINQFITLKMGPGGYSFQDHILKINPDLKGAENLPDTEREKKISEYVEGEYQKNNQRFSEFVEPMNKEWTEVEPGFFAITNKIFKNTPWPPGEYKGFYTISSPYPRLLDRKVFQVKYDPEKDPEGRWRIVAAHEMIHFIFFEFVRKKWLPELPDIKDGIGGYIDDKLRIPLWDLSEIFDTVLLNTEECQKLFPFPQRQKPAHEKYDEEYTRLWQETNGDIDLFLEKQLK